MRAEIPYKPNHRVHRSIGCTAVTPLTFAFSRYLTLSKSIGNHKDSFSLVPATCGYVQDPITLAGCWIMPICHKTRIATCHTTDTTHNWQDKIIWSALFLLILECNNRYNCELLSLGVRTLWLSIGILQCGSLSLPVHDGAKHACLLP